ncbi:MAG: 2-dehydro-3-deoxygalactonokinase [Thioclava marina]|uniref:2-dehydro-3-deoxygalactonokinase n=1 Tax=Thioclava marina TaxID=1915077 RepID=UPI0019ADD265|nr:2-dehydro-3-deoxygalactonokinase [Thioclava marina]MBC7147068.1 2-dehydro-3-deoxygalactonokinase [Thioclava marina]
MADWIALTEENGRWRALDVATGGQVKDRRSGPSPRPLLTEGVAATLAAPSVGLPPRPLPCTPLPEAAWPRAEIGGASLPALPGLIQTNDQTEVQPAEAARIAGVLAGVPQFDGVIWICGASALWAHVSAGEVVSVMRAASAALLAAMGAPLEAGADFDAALADTLSRPERLARELAPLSLGKTSERACGTVLGAELAAARPWWLGQSVLALSSPTAPGWSEICARALQAQGAQVTLGDGEAALIAGLAKARDPGA